MTNSNEVTVGYFRLLNFLPHVTFQPHFVVGLTLGQFFKLVLSPDYFQSPFNAIVPPSLPPPTPSPLSSSTSSSSFSSSPLHPPSPLFSSSSLFFPQRVCPSVRRLVRPSIHLSMPCFSKPLRFSVLSNQNVMITLDMASGPQ